MSSLIPELILTGILTEYSNSIYDIHFCAPFIYTGGVMVSSTFLHHGLSLVIAMGYVGFWVIID